MKDERVVRIAPTRTAAFHQSWPKDQEKIKEAIDTLNTAVEKYIETPVEFRMAVDKKTGRLSAECFGSYWLGTRRG
jgi:hypothetical protein